MLFHPVKSLFTFIFMGYSISLSQVTLDEILFEDTEQPDPEIVESLQNLQKDPADLNIATKDQLSLFPLFTEADIQRIINARKQLLFQDWEDFQKRTNMDEVRLTWVHQYFKIGISETNAPALNFENRERLQRKFPESRAYQSKKYRGDSWKNYQRTQFRLGEKIQGGWILEKDPGECQWNDHQSGYLSFQACGDKIQAIFGNFRIQTGLGLVLWGPYGTGKSALPASVIPKSSTPLKGYSYTDENQYLTGSALRVTAAQWQAILFYSQTGLDANRDSLIYSFPESGLHRTPSENSKKAAVDEKLFGGRIALNSAKWMIGCTGWKSYYSLPVITEDMIRDRFGFQGVSNHLIGLDWKFQQGKLCHAGEVAQSESGGKAIISYFRFQIKPVSCIVLYRDFSPDFQNSHAQGFGYGEPVNETGWYLGSRMRINRHTLFSFYMDLYRTPWRTYRLLMPEVKSDFFAQLEKHFYRSTNLFIRVRRVCGDVPAEGSTDFNKTIATTQNEIKHQLRVDFTFEPDPSWLCRSRIEFVRLHQPGSTGEIQNPDHQETGLLLFQDLKFHPTERLHFCLRYASFDTDSYNSRIYMFENDLPGVMTNASFYLKGSRTYILVQWLMWINIHVSLKYGLTYHDGAQSWGSGLDEIHGDVIKDIGFQIDWKR